MTAEGGEYRYKVHLCRACHHPGGQHILGGGCKLCRECPGWDEDNYSAGHWSDRMTAEALSEYRTKHDPDPTSEKD